MKHVITFLSAIAVAFAVALTLTACSAAPIEVDEVGQTSQAVSTFTWSDFCDPGTGYCIGDGIAVGGFMYLVPAGSMGTFPANIAIVPYLSGGSGNFQISVRLQSKANTNLCVSTMQAPSNGAMDAEMDVCGNADTNLLVYGNRIMDSSGALCLAKTPGSCVGTCGGQLNANRISWQTCSATNIGWAGIGYDMMISTNDVTNMGTPLYVDRFSDDDSCPSCISAVPSSTTEVNGIFQPTADQIWLAFLDSAGFSQLAPKTGTNSYSHLPTSWLTLGNPISPLLQMGVITSCTTAGFPGTTNGSWIMSMNQPAFAPYEVSAPCVSTHWYSDGPQAPTNFGPMSLCANNSCGGTSRDGSSMFTVYR